MTPPADPAHYKNHRFPCEIISHGVWLYYRFPLSDRDVQELLLERGIAVAHEAIPHWCLKVGQDYANQLRHRRAQPGDKWHLDEVFLTINSKQHYLWWAVDQHDNVLDILVQSRRNKKAAKKCFRKLLNGLQYVPGVIITDKLKRYSAAKREMLPGVQHRQSRYLNSRARTRIGRRGNGNIACNGLSPRVMPSAFCRRMDPLPNTSAPDGIDCRRRTAKRWGSDSRVGLK